MGIDSGTEDLSWASAPPQRRLTLTPFKLRLKEERKRVIRALDAKFRAIDDHERGMRRFVLIRNNLRRLQRESREEKFARHRTGLAGSRVSNLSPSCLSSTRPLTPSPSCDYGMADVSPISFGDAVVASSHPYEDDPMPKRQRLFFDDDKENEMELGDDDDSPSPFIDETQSDIKVSSTASCRQAVDDAQEILRDLYETCVSEGIAAPKAPSYAPCPAISPTSLESSSVFPLSTSYSLSLSASCSLSSSLDNCSPNSSSSNFSSCNNGNLYSNNSSNSPSDSDWPRPHSQYPFNCGQSSLLGNDLQSVVFHSLITSLES